MYSQIAKFAEDSSAQSGIGAFNINLKSFIFQLVTFLIVLAIFKRWILPPIVKTLEERRRTVEKSLEQAKETEEVLKRASQKAEEIIAKAREQADESLAEAKKSAASIIADAETAASERGSLIIKEAEAQLQQERAKLHDELRGELADLVIEATQKIIHEKLSTEGDRKLVEESLKGIG